MKITVFWKLSKNSQILAYTAAGATRRDEKIFKKNGYKVSHDRGFYFACCKIKELEKDNFPRCVKPFSQAIEYNEEFLTSLKTVNNEVEEFIKNFCVFNPQNKSLFVSFFKLHDRFCEIYNSKISNPAFKEQLPPEVKNTFCLRRSMAHEEGEWGFRGLSLIDTGANK